MAITQGVHHLGLTVPDIDTTRNFFVDVLQFQQVGTVPEHPDYFLLNGTNLLKHWQELEADTGSPFDLQAEYWSASRCLQGRWHRNIEMLCTKNSR